MLVLNFLRADRFALLFHAKMRATLTCALFEFGTWSVSGGARIEQIPVPAHAEAEMCGTSSGKLLAQLYLWWLPRGAATLSEDQLQAL